MPVFANHLDFFKRLDCQYVTFVGRTNWSYPIWNLGMARWKEELLVREGEGEEGGKN